MMTSIRRSTSGRFRASRSTAAVNSSIVGFMLEAFFNAVSRSRATCSTVSHCGPGSLHP